MFIVRWKETACKPHWGILPLHGIRTKRMYTEGVNDRRMFSLNILPCFITETSRLLTCSAFADLRCYLFPRWPSSWSPPRRSIPSFCTSRRFIASYMVDVSFLVFGTWVILQTSDDYEWGVTCISNYTWHCSRDKYESILHLDLYPTVFDLLCRFSRHEEAFIAPLLSLHERLAVLLDLSTTPKTRNFTIWSVGCVKPLGRRTLFS